MKKFLQEVFTYFWIPLIMGIVSYVFFQLRDVMLGVVILVALSAVYTVVRLYLLHKKWWLLVILGVVVIASGAYFLARSPAAALTINDNPVNGSAVSVTGGSVSVVPGPQTNGKYTKGIKVTLHASPAAGYDWKSWSGTDNDTSNPTTINIKGNTHITVAFEARPSLIINNQLVIGSVITSAEGSVTVNPVPGDDGKYTRGTVVTLTAKPASGYNWTSWSGTANDTSNPVQVTMNGNKQITANFEPRFSLIINNQLVIGSSVSFPEGSVTLSPSPGSDDKYASGTEITLTAIPATGYGWKFWSGTSSDNSNPAKVTVSSDKHVTVTFELRFYMTINNQAVTASSLTLTGGSVSISPAPGADGRFAKDATAVLTATPAQGYRFDRWSGDIPATTTSITVAMNANKNITVVFIKVYTLNASVNPAGGGTVSPASGGTYDENSNVVLTATPAAGYRFDHWTGDATGNINPITLNMNAARSVTAYFVRVYSLTALVNPAGSGSVSPGTGTFDESANVTLTATPAAGYRFDHWSGDASGNVSTANIIMSADKTVTANFVKVYNLTVSVSPTGGGSVSPAGGTYDTGASVTLTATAVAGYRFDHWTGDASGNTTSLTLIMTADKNVMAVFALSTP
ncbi:MAG: InlB B-repeat-containing protein [Dehalococcoidales bacterium]